MQTKRKMSEILADLREHLRSPDACMLDGESVALYKEAHGITGEENWYPELEEIENWIVDRLS